MIRKGVKEVVSYVYQQGDLNLEYFQANRAKYGTEAHQVVQEQYLDEECEVYIEHVLAVDEHEIQLSGRMDLLLERDGNYIVGEIKSISSGMPANTLRQFKSIEEEAPKRLEVLPVTILPSLSCIAVAGASVCSAFLSAAATTGRSFTVVPTCFINSSILFTSLCSDIPCLAFTRAL